jgi:hypothetical protein
MLRTLVIAREQRSGGWFQHRDFVVVAGEGSYGVESVEPGERDEGALVLAAPAR